MGWENQKARWAPTRRRPLVPRWPALSRLSTPKSIVSLSPPTAGDPWPIARGLFARSLQAQPIGAAPRPGRGRPNRGQGKRVLRGPAEPGRTVCGAARISAWGEEKGCSEAAPGFLPWRHRRRGPWRMACLPASFGVSRPQGSGRGAGPNPGYLGPWARMFSPHLLSGSLWGEYDDVAVQALSFPGALLTSPARMSWRLRLGPSCSIQRSLATKPDWKQSLPLFRFIFV